MLRCKMHTLEKGVFMTKKVESCSKEVEQLETQLKAIYGKKRGSAMIQAALQQVKYLPGSDKLTQMEATKLYITELRIRL